MNLKAMILTAAMNSNKCNSRRKRRRKILRKSRLKRDRKKLRKITLRLFSKGYDDGHLYCLSVYQLNHADSKYLLIMPFVTAFNCIGFAPLIHSRSFP